MDDTGGGGAGSDVAPQNADEDLVVEEARDEQPVAPEAPTEAEAEVSAPIPEGMVEIPAGIFFMGSPPYLGAPEERPVHEEAVASFYLDLTEVPLDAYRECVAAGKCAEARTTQRFCNEKLPDHGNHPANCVQWHDADDYCRYVGKRLPTETEWEYAASGGDEQRRFSWGDGPPTTKIACYDHPGGTCPVGQFVPGAFGLYDMSGNVWEWTASWFGPYPEVAETGSHKVFKGGSWSRWQPHWLRNRNRSRWEPKQYNAWLGFRCAKSKPSLECSEDAAVEGDRCVRVKGTPRCPSDAKWNGKLCVRLSGLVQPKGPTKPSDRPVGAPGPPDEPVVRSRTPQHDHDCKKLYVRLGVQIPNAYLWKGANFHKRAAMISAAGCKRRDTAPTWTSGCCAQ